MKILEMSDMQRTILQAALKHRIEFYRKRVEQFCETDETFLAEMNESFIKMAQQMLKDIEKR